MILTYSNNNNMKTVMGMNFEMMKDVDGKTRFQVIGATNIFFSSTVKNHYIIGDTLRVETVHSVYEFDLLPSEKEDLIKLFSRREMEEKKVTASTRQLYYLFDTNDLMLCDHVAKIGNSKVNGNISLIGPVYEIKENEGKLLMFNNGHLIFVLDYEYSLSYDGECSYSPQKDSSYGDVGASNMKIYRKQGARYMFVPISAKLQVTK